MIDPKQFAARTLQILQDDPRAYRNFGPYWYFVKALMKRYYTRDNLRHLGDYDDPAMADHMPEHGNMQDALQGAVDFYRGAAAYGMGTNEFVDENGEQYIVNDPDAGL